MRGAGAHRTALTTHQGPRAEAPPHPGLECRPVRPGMLASCGGWGEQTPWAHGSAGHQAGPGGQGHLCHGPRQGFWAATAVLCDSILGWVSSGGLPGGGCTAPLCSGGCGGASVPGTQQCHVRSCWVESAQAGPPGPADCDSAVTLTVKAQGTAV